MQIEDNSLFSEWIEDVANHEDREDWSAFGEEESDSDHAEF